MHISPGKFIFEHGICVWFFKSCVLFGDRFSSPVINISHRQCVTRHTAHIHIHILHASPRTAVEWFRMGLFFFWVLCEVCHRNMLKCIKELYVCACPCHMNEMECHIAIWATHDGQTCDMRHADTFAVSLPRLMWLNPSQISVRKNAYHTEKREKHICPVSYYGQF